MSGYLAGHSLSPVRLLCAEFVIGQYVFSTELSADCVKATVYFLAHYLRALGHMWPRCNAACKKT